MFEGVGGGFTKLNVSPLIGGNWFLGFVGRGVEVYVGREC